jgi:hypothetical protein
MIRPLSKHSDRPAHRNIPTISHRYTLTQFVSDDLFQNSTYRAIQFKAKALSSKFQLAGAHLPFPMWLRMRKLEKTLTDWSIRDPLSSPWKTGSFGRLNPPQPCDMVPDANNLQADVLGCLGKFHSPPNSTNPPHPPLNQRRGKTVTQPTSFAITDRQTRPKTGDVMSGPA